MEKYHILKEIGEGNYGKAVLVKNLIDKNLYVIKSIDISNFNKNQLDNALYEVNLIKNLRHPYIVKYVESFYEESFLCIVMEYADCGDLYKLIKSQKKINILLKEEIILNWFVQLCFAVKYIHDKNIVHRDLKLSNIFLCSNGDLKLGDFGISKELSEKEQFAKTIVGTPYYLSPEICMKQPYNQKSDIWSLGCILYEIMNLKHAFEANNIGELILKILKGEYEPIQESFSSEIKELVKEMLETDTAKRPDINTILEKPFLKKYIKLTLIRQISHSDQKTAAPFINKNLINPNSNDNSYSNCKEIKTRSNSSDSSRLNLKFNSNPKTLSATSDSQKNNSALKDSNSVGSTINLGDENTNTIYKIDSECSSKNSSNRLTASHKNSNSYTHSSPAKNKVPMTNQDITKDKSSVFSKIEKLKKILENFLGLENFLEIYSQINNYYLENKKELNIDFSKYNISDKKSQEDVIKLIKSLIRLENDLFNH